MAEAPPTRAAAAVRAAMPRVLRRSARIVILIALLASAGGCRAWAAQGRGRLARLPVIRVISSSLEEWG